jgi:hypothetical protein
MSRAFRLFAAPLLLLAAACTDRTPTATVPAPAPPSANAALIACHADVRALAMTCDAAAPRWSGGASAAVLGGQGVNVRLRNTPAVRENGEFRMDVTVENLVAQALGTADGVTPAPEGVRIYFAVAPYATRGEGEVSVANPDGQAFFTEANQDFFRYDGILAPGDTSAPREWRFALADSVQAFSFQVYVAGAVAHEVGWIGVSPPVPSVGVGEAMPLAATVHGVSGRPLPGHIVAWSSSDTSIVTVAADGTVTGVGIGFATVTASSNGRTGSAVVHVGSSAGDGVPPTVREFAFSPARVSADGTDSVTVDVRLADPGAGVASVSIAFGSPTAEHGTTCFGLAPLSGTRADGVFRCRIAIRPFSEGGVWRVRHVTMDDQAGNGRVATGEQLEAAGISTSLYVRSAEPDVAAPALASLDFAPDSALADGVDSVTVRMRVTDAGVGVMYAGVRFNSPSATLTVQCSSVTPTAGTVHDGTYACRLAFPAGAEGGTWRVQSVSAADSLGNTLFLLSSQLREAGFPTQLHVTSLSGDVTPPALTDFAFTPDSVAADGVDSVTVTMEFADAGVGVQQAAVAFDSPSGSTSATCHALEPVRGTRSAGTFQCSLVVPSAAETGAWEVSYLQVSDAVGNTTLLFGDDIQTAGYPTTLHVKS